MPHRPIPSDRLEGLASADAALTPESAAARLERFGYNDIVEAPRHHWTDLARDTARDPMIWFLVGVGLLFAVIGDYTEALVLAAALLPLVGMDAYLHRRTQASTRGLASRLAARTTTIRGKAAVELPARELVPGDLVLVRAGEPFPADGILVAGDELQTDESSLTGEALPARKRPLAAIPVAHPTADANWAFAGTRLLTGQARLRIVYTGAETLYGEIVRSALAGSHARTPLQVAVTGLVGVMLIVALIVCIALAAIRLEQGHGVVDALLSAVTLAVAALPEEFPVVFTFFLGVGVYRLARRQALVRRAVAVENIGRITCICSDKTGTLTEGRLTLSHRLPADGISPERLTALAAFAAREESEDPLDLALAEATNLREPVVRLATFPFTEDRRRETAVLRLGDGSCIAVVKGAPETVLGMSAENRASRSNWEKHVATLATTGHKVIACATRRLDEPSWPGGEPDRGYALAGLLAFEDRLREGVGAAVQECRNAGIRVVMVTGDHPTTTAAIAREIGLGGKDPVVVTADMVVPAATARHASLLGSADAIARAAPAQKLELVRALQAVGEVVAVTGDGVNDVPALQAADIGIAMGERGTRSAREVAAIVLLDDNFRTIVRAIAEGRQLFRNLQLSFAYLLTVHIPLVLSAALVPLSGYPLLYLPTHVVWLELIIHPTALLVFQDLPTSARLARVEYPGAPRFFSLAAWLAIGIVGALVTAVVIFGYKHAVGDQHDVEHARGMALTAFIVAGATITAILSGLRSWASPVVILGSLASLVCLVQLPALAALMHVRPLDVGDLAVAVASGGGAGLCAFGINLALRHAARAPSAELRA